MVTTLYSDMSKLALDGARVVVYGQLASGLVISMSHLYLLLGFKYKIKTYMYTDCTRVETKHV